LAKWVTREHVHVDRVACPWLIRKYIDPEAEFIFVPVEEIEAVVERTGATPFDAPGVELGHHGDDCSFETFLKKYRLSDPILQDMARIVHAADIEKDLSQAPEAAGLEAISRGQMYLVRDDQEAVDRGSYIYDCLYSYCLYRRVIEENEDRIASEDRRKRYRLIRDLMGGRRQPP
jgi:hypothetical protein